LHQFQFDFAAMGSPCALTLFGKQRESLQPVADRVIADVRRLEGRYSRYRDDSFLAEINRVAAKGGSIQVDPETASLLDYADTCYLQSGGLFDVTSGILRRAWHKATDALPEQGAIDDLFNSVGWDKLRWEAPVLSFPVPGLELDLGGIVKEYAVDRAAAMCREAGVKHGVVNLGGDLCIIGPHPEGRPWHVGISHPRKAGERLATLALNAGAVATSGDYERCIVLDGVRYSHVLNRHSGWPVRHLASVSVVADLCVVAGSASTIAMLKECEGPDWLRELGIPHLWMDTEGNVGGTLHREPAGSQGVIAGPDVY
jgi:thiamine biosynthesis lipoprotein